MFWPSCFHFFSKNSFRSKSLDLDQARHFVGPDLGPNCLQNVSVDNTRRKRVKVVTPFENILSCKT